MAFTFAEWRKKIPAEVAARLEESGMDSYQVLINTTNYDLSTLGLKQGHLITVRTALAELHQETMAGMARGLEHTYDVPNVSPGPTQSSNQGENEVHHVMPMPDARQQENERHVTIDVGERETNKCCTVQRRSTCVLVLSALTTIFCFWAMPCGFASIILTWKARNQILEKKMGHARNSVCIVWVLLAVSFICGSLFWWRHFFLDTTSSGRLPWYAGGPYNYTY